MKTIEQLFSEIMKNDELEAKFLSAVKEQKLDEFLKENEVDATKDDFKNFVIKEAQTSGALSDDELAAVAGGNLWEDFKDAVRKNLPGVSNWIDEKWYE